MFIVAPENHKYIHVHRSSVRMSRKTFAMSHDRDDARKRKKENKTVENCVKNKFGLSCTLDFY